MSHPSWAQHDAGFTLQVGIRVNPSGWGGCPEDPVYLFYNYRFGGESDKRLKSDIKPLTHTLDQICSIPTDSFTKSGVKQIGTIAQDLEKIIPEIVSEDYKLASEVPNKEEFEIIQHQNKDQVDDYIKVKKVEYDMLGVIAIEGIKLLKQEIDKLNNRIKELENGRDSDVEHD